MFPFRTSEEMLTYLKNTSMKDGPCPVLMAINLVSGKWELKLLLQLLKEDTLRFGELKKRLPGITNTVLTTTLKKFEAAGIVQRIQFNEIPPHVEYSLSNSGKGVADLFFELAKWSDEYLQVGKSIKETERKED